MRVFLAIDLPDWLKEELFQLEGKLRFIKAKFVEKENFHITLKFLGELPPNKVNDIINLLKDVKFEKFKAYLKGTGVFPNRNFIRVVWVGVGEGQSKIIELQKNIDIRLRKLGFAMERDFVPHVTLARVKEVYNKEKFLEILEELNSYKSKYFEVDKFVLKESKLTPKGPIYRDVEIFNLG